MFYEPKSTPEKNHDINIVAHWKSFPNDAYSKPKKEEKGRQWITKQELPQMKHLAEEQAEVLSAWLPTYVRQSFVSYEFSLLNWFTWDMNSDHLSSAVDELVAGLQIPGGR